MAAKIKDALFIGDMETAEDPEFIELNKIAFLINCSGVEISNRWENHGLSLSLSFVNLLIQAIPFVCILLSSCVLSTPNPSFFRVFSSAYLTFEWEDRDGQVIFDHKFHVLQQISNFINGAFQQGSSVLVFSTNGIGRCCVCIMAYLMANYRSPFFLTFFQLSFICFCLPLLL